MPSDLDTVELTLVSFRFLTLTVCFIDLNIINSRMVNGTLIADSVPYSCCDVAAIRPCINEDVSSSSKHSNYDPEEPTLYRQGCVEPLIGFMEQSIILPTAGIAFTAMFLEVKNVYNKFKKYI